jgi:hypothetical protein|tara:strand:- start:417 stop:596 length:180 start_codon:yes stop_codon:yes gene_type:complete
MAVLPGTTWINVDRPYFHLFKAALHFFGDKLRSIIATDKPGHPTFTYHFAQVRAFIIGE